MVTCEGIVETEDNAGVIGRHSGPLPLMEFFCRQDPAYAAGPENARPVLREVHGPVEEANPLVSSRINPADPRTGLPMKGRTDSGYDRPREAVSHGFLAM